MMSQSDFLQLILNKNKTIRKILVMAPELKMPNWYLGAGCIAQTVWNHFHKFEIDSNIKDYDLVYFDSSDVSYEKEDFYIQNGKKLFARVSTKIEIVNEARVHLWYEKHFGFKLTPYVSVENAIDTWPTTATSIGIKCGENEKLKIYAPFGLDDLLNMVVRANKTQITKDIYMAKVGRWRKNWPKLKIIPWD